MSGDLREKHHLTSPDNPDFSLQVRDSPGCAEKNFPF